MSISLKEGCPSRRADVWLRQAGEENALYDPRTGSLHLLNHTAFAIWDLCDGQTRPEEMIEAICQLSGHHRDVVAEDVERILGGFDKENLLVWMN